ncbi:hypothetical protein SADUNF_Sadunf08G0094700 [Salix dunnii]|uniref:Uncharacterized protein n=1 Tax=Salix dunnii TaxID=1413687 RepID=A0A835JZP5_9ROSI|nr:hypothetical protein SADUNF_Sadunf08G0094700 [Salix dunnii]
MKCSKEYGLVYIHAELVPILVNDRDGYNDYPNREKDKEHNEEILVNVHHLPPHPVLQSKLEMTTPGTTTDLKVNTNLDKRPILSYVLCLFRSMTRKWFLDHLVADLNVSNRAFDEWILYTRVTMTIRKLEEITVTIINRLLVKMTFALKWKASNAPKMLKIIEKNRVEAIERALKYNGDGGYEIIKGDMKHIVELRNKTCMCGAWIFQALHSLVKTLRFTWRCGP